VLVQQLLPDRARTPVVSHTAAVTCLAYTKNRNEVMGWPTIQRNRYERCANAVSVGVEANYRRCRSLINIVVRHDTPVTGGLATVAAPAVDMPRPKC